MPFFAAIRLTIRFSIGLKPFEQKNKTRNISIWFLLSLVFFTIACSSSGDDEPVVPETVWPESYTAGDGSDIKSDVKVIVASGTATSVQSGTPISNSFDGSYSTIYHSNWSNGASDYFPITLTYQFSVASDVDYIVYYPRNDGSANGRFKEVEILYSNDGTNFTSLMTKDFQASASATVVNLSTTVKAKAFRFIVKSGGNNFASCAEMEFYAKNPNNFVYSTLFEDEICSKLKAGVTEKDIENCAFPFFKTLAHYIYKGAYSEEFRVAEFNAYPNPNIQAAINKTSPYSLLDNPTGIAVEAGQNLIVIVGDTHGYNVSLRVQDLESTTDGYGGTNYALRRGVNKLNITTKGLVYVIYQTATLDDANALPIKMHFASGTLNGYFDSQKHAGRWYELLSKATNKYFDVVGKYAHLTFETADFRQYTGAQGEDLINTYDNIVYSEQLLMGLKKYNKMFRNRMYLHVIYTSGAWMYSTSYHTAYVKGTMSTMCNPTALKADCWGPAHEIGHCNQTRPGLKWLGTTEVTTNIMSEYIQTTILKNNSRLQVSNAGNNYRNIFGKAWNLIITANAPHATCSDVFSKLVPFWQLELYFGKALHRTPLLQSDFGGFYPDVYEYIRNNENLSTAGLQQTEFVYICSKVSGYNLLDFFTKWGFLTPIDVQLDDYSQGMMTVTQSRIDDIKQRVEALGLPKPNVPLEYITDFNMELFASKPAIVKGTATRSGNKLTMNGWQNVVAYEVVDKSGGTNVLKFANEGINTASDTAWFELPFNWQDSFKVYAVAANNSRTEVTF